MSTFVLSGVLTKAGSDQPGGARLRHSGRPRWLPYSSPGLQLESSGRFARGLPGYPAGRVGGAGHHCWSSCLPPGAALRPWRGETRSKECSLGDPSSSWWAVSSIGRSVEGVGFASIEPFFGGLFTGVVTLFLLETGNCCRAPTARREESRRGCGCLCRCVPRSCGIRRVSAGLLAGLSVGACTLGGFERLLVLYRSPHSCSARLYPKPSPGIYLTARLGYYISVQSHCRHAPLLLVCPRYGRCPLMDLVDRKLVTIVAESALEKRLVEDLSAQGIKGLRGVRRPWCWHPRPTSQTYKVATSASSVW